MPRQRSSTNKSKQNNATSTTAAEKGEEEQIVFDVIDEDRSLLSSKRVRLHPSHDDHHYHNAVRAKNEWARPYWLGAGLFLALAAFWVLDTLKDPVFGQLTGGNLEKHQPPAKLFSVCTTLVLVCFLEYIAHERKKQVLEQQRSVQDILDSGGTWERMNLEISRNHEHHQNATYPQYQIEAQDRVPSSIFASIGIPYCIAFGILAYILQFNAVVTETASVHETPKKVKWHVLGYFFFALIESFGSVIVATFWSYTNSTLNLHDAEQYYGIIIAVAQLGAIFGSTMVTTHVWSTVTLVVLACLIILLHILVMHMYSRRFPPTNLSDEAEEEQEERIPEGATTTEPTFWSGIYLILKYNYVLLILGASCLYEVSLTCLNYQMTLLGWNRFVTEEDSNKMTFTQFMGHYGQMVNISSLLLSSIVFPWLLRRFGLRITLRLFPTLLLAANVVAFGALPGNLAVLFFSISILKAMTYSIHDPSKEILYLPTSNAIKFKSKFWIDVVGARVAKAVGSSINTYAGSVDRSIRVASTPSLLTALALWLVCYRVGIQFDSLVSTNTVVGLDSSPILLEEYGELYQDEEDEEEQNNQGKKDDQEEARHGSDFADPLSATELESMS